CGPIYSTEYIFTPPDGSTGNFCISQCEESKFQCEDLENMRNERCEEESRYQEERCRDRVWADKGREPKWYECGGNSCTADTERCDERYRGCYQACGGKVETVTRCVANCPPAAPPPAR